MKMTAEKITDNFPGNRKIGTFTDNVTNTSYTGEVSLRRDGWVSIHPLVEGGGAYLYSYAPYNFHPSTEGFWE